LQILEGRPGNIISGQIAGVFAKSLSVRFGKIVQVKGSISINTNDTSVSKSGRWIMQCLPQKLQHFPQANLLE
jgi:hypothetical protein